MLVDLDPQGNLTATATNSTIEPGDMGSSYSILTHKQPAEDCIIHLSEHLGIIPASATLARADIELANTTGREYRLKEALQTIRESFDIVLIDCPPALGTLTACAMTAADWLIVPAQADAFSLAAIRQLAGIVSTVQTYTNSRLRVAGILLTRYQQRNILSRDMRLMLSDAAGCLGTALFGTAIRESVAVKEAQFERKDVVSYKPNSPVAGDFVAVFHELQERIGTTYGTGDRLDRDGTISTPGDREPLDDAIDPNEFIDVDDARQ